MDVSFLLIVLLFGVTRRSLYLSTSRKLTTEYLQTLRRDVGLAISMPIIAIFAVLLRIHARRIKRTALSVDDYLAVAALVKSILIQRVTLTKFR